jgi:hypothetical protein
VRRLPEQQRSALLMREMDGLSYAELAEALGVSLQAVKSLLVRARIGLVEAVEARDTACSAIRLDLADAFDRGVRASGLARRHLRDCDGCVAYRTQLRTVRHGLNVLSPVGPGPLAALLKLAGIGGAGSAGAASAGAASAGGAGAAGGGALAVATTGTAAKVAAVVCCAALTATSAVEVRDHIAHPSSSKAAATAPQRTVARATAVRAASTAQHAAPAIAAAGATARRHADAATPAAASVATAGRYTRSAPGPTLVVTEDPAATSAPVADGATGGASAPGEDPAGAGEPLAAPRPATSSAPAAAPTSGSGMAGAKPYDVIEHGAGGSAGSGPGTSGTAGGSGTAGTAGTAGAASGSIPPG